MEMVTDGAAEGHHRQRRASRRAGSLPQPQDRAGAAQGRRQARQRHRPDPAQGQAPAARPLPAPAQGGEEGGVTAQSSRMRAQRIPGSAHSACAKTPDSAALHPGPQRATMALESSAKPAMHAPLALRTTCLTPDNDPSPAPFGAFAPNAAQAAIIRLAQRSRLKRGAFRPMLSRLVNLLRAGPIDVQYQGASFRFYHQASATERGALFNPDYNIEELDFLRAHTPVRRRVRRCRRQCRHLCAGAGASCRRLTAR